MLLPLNYNALMISDFSPLLLVADISQSPATAAFLASIPIYLIIASGWICRRVGWVSPESDKGFMKITIELCYPCLILVHMLGNDLLRSPLYSLKAAGIGAGTCILSIIICLLIARLLKLKKGDGARTFAITTAVQNYSFYIVPMIAVLYTAPNDPTMGVLFTFNVGMEFTLWTVGLMVMSEVNKLKPSMLLRGPIVAVLLGLFLVWTGLDRTIIPTPVTSTLGMLGNCAVPLALFLVGTTLYDLWGKFKWSLKISLGSILTRCALLPIVLLIFAYFLPVDPIIKRILVFQASVPAAMVPIIIARHFGGRPAVAVEVVIATTLGALITLPLWLSTGFKFILP